MHFFVIFSICIIKCNHVRILTIYRLQGAILTTVFARRISGTSGGGLFGRFKVTFQKLTMTNWTTKKSLKVIFYIQGFSFFKIILRTVQKRLLVHVSNHYAYLRTCH